MHKDHLESLGEGTAIAYREKTSAWKQGEDRPDRVTYHGYVGRKVLIRFEDGAEREVAATKLLCPWPDVDRLLANEAAERAFLEHTGPDAVVSHAAALVLELAVDDDSEDDEEEYAWGQTDRVYVTPKALAQILAAAGIDEPLSEVCHAARVHDNGDTVLPLPFAAELAERIAKRRPDEVVAATDAQLAEFMEKGYESILNHRGRYLPAWNAARKWAGAARLKHPDEEKAAVSGLTPEEALSALRERCRAGRRIGGWEIDADGLRSVLFLLPKVVAGGHSVTIEPLLIEHADSPGFTLRVGRPENT